MTNTDHHTCYTCNTPVLPANRSGDIYEYTVVHWNTQYVFCSTACKAYWETDVSEGHPFVS